MISTTKTPRNYLSSFHGSRSRSGNNDLDTGARINHLTRPSLFHNAVSADLTVEAQEAITRPVADWIGPLCYRVYLGVEIGISKKGNTK